MGVGEPSIGEVSDVAPVAAPVRCEPARVRGNCHTDPGSHDVVTSSHTRHLLFAALLLLIILIVAASQLSDAGWLLAREWGARLQAQGLSGVLIVWLIGMLATAVGLPRQLLAFIAGFAYGAAAGLILSLSAAVAGCALTCLVANRLLGSWVRARYPRQVDAIRQFLRDDLFLKVLFLRLQPLGTNLLTNLSAGLLAVPLPTFLLASAVGYVPQMLVFVLLGSGIRVGSDAQLWTSAALLVSSLTLGWVLYRRYRRSLSS